MNDRSPPDERWLIAQAEQKSSNSKPLLTDKKQKLFLEFLLFAAKSGCTILALMVQPLYDVLTRENYSVSSALMFGCSRP